MSKLEELLATRDRLLACESYTDDAAGRAYKAQDLRRINQEIADCENGIINPTMKIVNTYPQEN